MANEPHFPVYGAGPGAGAPGLGILGHFLVRAASRRSATITTPDHIEVHTASGIRRTAWRDIQAIEIVDAITPRTRRHVPVDTGQYVAIYDHTGRRTELPHVNTTHVASLTDELRVLRELWERLRGPDWTPRPRGEGPAAR
ncbi:hypothetical protein [Streptomyces sp. 6N223]|uniref:hypothetical protein n=1 Tax=Streptomyces sp. 6N223 TaxID=3457412 RepID=UPI003FD4BECA